MSSSISLTYLTIHLGYAFALAAFLYAARSWLTKSAMRIKASYDESKLDSYVYGTAIGVISGATSMFLKFPLPLTVGCVIAGSIFAYKSHRAKSLVKFATAYDLALIEALQVVTSSLRAGLPLPDSIQAATEHAPAIFSTPIQSALRQYHLGKSFEDALKEMRDQTPTRSNQIAFGAMQIGYHLGGNLPKMLARIALTIRERGRVQGRLRTLTAQGRTQAGLLCMAPPGIGVIMAIWDPEKFALLTDTLPGQVILFSAIALELIGIFAMQKVLKLEI